MIHLAYLMPLLPLGGFVVLATAGRRLGDPWAGWLATATVAGSFVVALLVTVALLSHPAGSGREQVDSLFRWISVGPLQVSASLLIDPLSMTMALFVTGVSALIHLYSIGYMRGDSDYPKFFLYLNLFVASMLLLVLGDNLLFTFVGWEGVGVCSYWLIAFWFGRPSAASAGKKAFLYNRLADVGFLLAAFLVFSRTGTLTYGGAGGFLAHAAALSPATRTAVCLLLFLAAAGKSAQLPLFPWLADAMEGPTPVSALIHAATMVTAGVYLMCRVSPLLALSHPAQLVIAVVGAATAFIAATIACTQSDIKKVLAYSTVSQLGYMFLGVGTGAYEAAVFLMVAHAFFKGLLFLGAGSVIHGVGDEQDMKAMGGLGPRLRLTCVTLGLGVLAIAGIPPLAGFWAKGDVLDNALARYPVLWAVGLLTALLTAYYATRLFTLTFTGEPRWRASGHGEPHDAPPVMAVPLVVLSVLVLFGGALDLPGLRTSWDPLGWLGPLFGSALYQAHQSGATQWVLGFVDAAVALVGLTLAYRLWRGRVSDPRLEPVFLQRAWRLDDLYDAVLGRPATAFARFSAEVIDARVIDGAVRGVGTLTRQVGSGLRRAQGGFLRRYALGITLGAVVLLVWALTVAQAWSR